MHRYFKKLARGSSFPSSSKSEISVNEYCEVNIMCYYFLTPLPNFPAFATGRDNVFLALQWVLVLTEDHNEDREVLVLFLYHISWPWDSICAQ